MSKGEESRKGNSRTMELCVFSLSSTSFAFTSYHDIASSAFSLMFLAASTWAHTPLTSLISLLRLQFLIFVMFKLAAVNQTECEKDCWHIHSANCKFLGYSIHYFLCFFEVFLNYFVFLYFFFTYSHGFGISFTCAFLIVLVSILRRLRRE